MGDANLEWEHLEPKKEYVIQQATVSMDADIFAVVEVIVRLNVKLKPNVIVNLFGVAMLNAILVEPK